MVPDLRPAVLLTAATALLLLSPATAAPCQSYGEELLVPTLAPVVPPGPPGLLITVVAIVPAAGPSGGTYNLEAIADVTTISMSPCLAFPDFNVAWFEATPPFDDEISHHTTCGNQGGAVHRDADYGLVYMRYGPDALQDEHLLASFRITVCPGN